MPLDTSRAGKTLRKVPLARAFDPDAIELELGMDVLAGDLLVHLHLTNHTPADIVHAVMGLGEPVLATGWGELVGA